MNKPQLVEIFEDTNLYAKGFVSNSKTTKHNFDNIITENYL